MAIAADSRKAPQPLSHADSSGFQSLEILPLKISNDWKPVLRGAVAELFSGPQMKPLCQLLTAVATLAACVAGAQTTNFAIRKPPRSYDAVVRLHNVEAGAPVADKDAEHFFSPSLAQGQGASGANASGEGSGAANAGARTVKRRTVAKSSDDRPTATLAEIAAGRDDARGAQLRPGGVASEILGQQRSAASRVEAQRSLALAQQEATPATRQPSANEGSVSLMSGQDAAAAMLLKQQQDGSTLPNFSPARSPADDVFRAGLVPQNDPARRADLRGAANDGLFSRAADNPTAFQRDNPALDATLQQPGIQPLQPANDPRLPAGIGDLKRPTTLPW